MKEYKFTERGTLIVGNCQYFIGEPLTDRAKQDILEAVSNAFRLGQNERSKELRDLLGVRL